MPRAPEVEFFVAPFLLSFLPFFAGKSAIFIAKSDGAGNASGRGSGKKRQCSEGQIPGRHRGGLTPLLYFKNPLVRLVQFAYKNVTHAVTYFCSELWKSDSNQVGTRANNDFSFTSGGGGGGGKRGDCSRQAFRGGSGYGAAEAVAAAAASERRLT